MYENYSTPQVQYAYVDVGVGNCRDGASYMGQYWLRGLPASECQSYCTSQPFCEYYDFRGNDRQCTLYGQKAREAVKFNAGFHWHDSHGHATSMRGNGVSGSACKKKATSSPFTKVGTGNCRDAGGNYVNQHWKGGLAPAACEKACADTPKCHYYDFRVSDGECAMYGSAFTSFTPSGWTYHIHSGNGMMAPMLGNGAGGCSCYIKNKEAAAIPRITGRWHCEGKIDKYAAKEGTTTTKNSVSAKQFGMAVKTGISLTTEANAAIEYGPVTAGSSTSYTASVDVTMSAVMKYSESFGRSESQTVTRTCLRPNTSGVIWVWYYYGEFQGAKFRTSVPGGGCAYTQHCDQEPRCNPGFCDNKQPNCQACHAGKELVTPYK